jgi:predicted outer membrane protein
MIAARSKRRLHRWSVGVLAMTLTVLLAPAGMARAADATPVPVPPNTGLTDKGAGAVTAADRDFIIKVRLAGLWEIPAGNMAVEKSEDPRIVNIGRTIAQQHVVLDKLDIAVAKKLGVALPNQPNSDQQGWLNEMKNASSSETFNQIYIDRLRAAHGKIFPAIATVRASTRNDTVRKLAQRTNQFVATHMTLLETSGIVDFKALPTAPAPNASTGPTAAKQVANTASQSAVSTANLPVLLVVLVGGLLVGGFATSRLMGNRRRPSRRW